MGEHKLEIKFSGEDLHDKKSKKDLLCKIKKYVCALMNSGGGTLSLRFTNVTVNQNIPDNIVGPVEVFYRDILNSSQLLKNFKIREETENGLTFIITASFSMITLCYNLYLPTETQLMAIRPIESHSEVQRILERNVLEVNEDEVPKSFTVGKSSGLRESQTVQLKNLKSGQSQSQSTFANRVMNNKFTHYVSAFANERGGRIYYGIEDNGKVEGEDITEEEKDEVKKRVKDKINKMKWNRIEPQEGEHWSMEFKPVIDWQTGEFIPSKFVMIIYIAPCLGGVFTEEPESYYIEQGEVKKAEFNDWLVHFKMSRQPWPISFTPRHVSSCVSWSSAHQRDVYLQFTTLLVQCRNDNRKEEFSTLRRLAKHERYLETSAPLVVISEAVAVQYKQGRFDEAYQLLNKFEEKLVQSSQDIQFHIVKLLYLRSRIKRANGECEESYEMAKKSLNELEKIPAEFITVWYYMHLAMLANTLGARNNDPDMFLEAQQWLYLASRDANALDAFPGGFADLHQKLQIYQAMTLLRSSLTGEVSDECVDPGNVDAATTTLSNAYNSVMRGNLMTIYREIQLLFGQCSIYLRRSQLSNIWRERLEYLKRALIWAKQAEDLAKKCNFNDMVSYAATFQRTIEKFKSEI